MELGEVSRCAPDWKVAEVMIAKEVHDQRNTSAEGETEGMSIDGLCGRMEGQLIARRRRKY
jgi:hypothetical protein